MTPTQSIDGVTMETKKVAPMIRKVTIRRFKRFEEHIFDLKPFNLLVGPNNHGKTTLLQALSAWQLAYSTWKSARRVSPGRIAKKVRGVPIPLPNFHCVPLTDFKHLWTGKRTQWFDHQRYDEYKKGSIDASEKKSEDKPKEKYQGTYDVEITVEWDAPKTDDEPSEMNLHAFGMVLQYTNEQSIIVKPTPETQELPQSIDSIVLTHIPPFSGLDPHEEYLADGAIRRRIGLSQPGSVVRNLLWRVYQGDENRWADLKRNVRKYLNVKLIDPEFREDIDPHITCLYEDLRGEMKEPFDLVNGGSGFHQLVTLFAILYWNRGTHLLLDEPDAHLHAWAQAGILGFLKEMTRKRETQVIIATHSIAMLDRCKPEDVYSMMSPRASWLVQDKEKYSIRSGLDSVETSLLSYLERIPAILYVEGSSDIEILRLIAASMGKDDSLFDRIPYHVLGGRDPKSAREHYLGVRSFRDDCAGICLLDPDIDRPGLQEAVRHHREEGLEFFIWQRRHLESYMLVPEAIARAANMGAMFENQIIEAFRDFLAARPRAVLFPENVEDYRKLHLDWMETFDAKRWIFSPYPKDGGFIHIHAGGNITPQHVAQCMTSDEVHEDVARFIERLYALCGNS